VLIAAGNLGVGTGVALIQSPANTAANGDGAGKRREQGEPLMETIIPGLYASAPEPLGFGPSLEIRAFLLQRERGNLLIYRASTLEQDVEAVGDLGGVSRQYLNHHHEASPACDWVARTFGAPLHVHEADARAVSEICNVDETFSERHKLDEDFEIIPVPGHTSGATAFLWDTGQHRAP
jgi:hypothetical protein